MTDDFYDYYNTQSWVQRVSRSVMPVGSIEKYALRIDISSHKALVGGEI